MINTLLLSLALWTPPTTTAPTPPPEPTKTPPAPTTTTPEEKRRTERIAVYDLEVGDVDVRTARIATDALVVELRKLQGTSVVSMDEVRAMLEHEASKALVGCSDESCLADIADALGVDTLITGSITRVGSETVFGVRRIDQRTATTTARVTQRVVTDDGRETLAVIGPLVEQLYPDRPLLSGQTRGVADAVLVRLNPPPIPVWATTTTLGTGGLLLTAGGVTGVLVLLTQGDVEALVAAGQDAPVDARLVKDGVARGEALALATNVLVGSGLVVAAAGGVLVPLTDWTNAAAE